MRSRGLRRQALVLALMWLPPRARAAETVSGVSAVARNGDLIVANVRLGFVSNSLLRPGSVLAGPAGFGVGLLGEAGLGLGGASLGVGPALVWNAGHPFGFNTLALQAKVLRPWLLSPWAHAFHGGVELSLGLAILHATVGYYTRDPSKPGTSSHIQAGAGLRLWF
jgi:hypothetical protein